MRKLAIMAALASTALATPAVARDNSWYVGVEGGLMLVEDTELDYFYDDGETVVDVANGIVLDHNVGVDVDLIAGYDFGGFRVEGELGWKRASLDEARIDGTVIDDLTGVYEVDGSVRVLSAMINGLLDFGDDDGWSGYVGAGVGLAKIKHSIDVADFADESESDGAMAWQVIAGLRTAVSDNVDVGLKYRFFNTAKFKYGNETEFGELEGKFRSHSLLLSLIYNFAPPPPPPPPPPPAAATPVKVVKVAPRQFDAGSGACCARRGSGWTTGSNWPLWAR